MMSASGAALLAGIIVSLFLSAPSAGFESAPDEQCTEKFTGDSQDGQSITADLTEECPTPGPGGQPGPVYDWVPRCDGIPQFHLCRKQDRCGNDGYLFQAFLDGVEVKGHTKCVEESDPVPQLTVSMVASIAWRLEWPASTLLLDPVSGRNFVNKENVFRTTNTSPSTQVVRAFGHRITIEAAPAEYEWIFGDGTSTVTTEPGRAYPSRDITHVYLTKGTFSPSVSTIYRARYRVDNGAWQSIPTTFTLPGPSVPLEIVTARPTLVS